MNNFRPSSSCYFVLFVVSSPCFHSVVVQAQQLLLVDGDPMLARLIQVDTTIDTTREMLLRFDTDQGQRTIALQNLVRWSTPRNRPPADELLLDGGSRLVLADSWTGVAGVMLTEDTVVGTTAQFGRVNVPRSQLRAIVFGASARGGRQDELRERLLAWRGKGDQLHLSGGDVLTGRLEAIDQDDAKIQNDATKTRVTFQSDAGQIKLPLQQIAGIALGFVSIREPWALALGEDTKSTEATSPEASAFGSAQLAVGLRDGSWLVAQSLVADEKRLQIILSTGQEIQGGSARDIATVQSLGDRVVYLSDLQPTDYRHVPYLEIPWPYARDRNVLGESASAGGKMYPKSLGMHTASRLTYNIDKSWHRFAAEIAVDDAAGGGGSIVFRVYLWQQGVWQVAYASGVVRGGDPPSSISVDLAGAEQIALVTDYADRGDQRDYANWLDARFLVRQ